MRPNIRIIDLIMKKRISAFLILSLLICYCTFPQYIWPQKDIDFQEINQSTLENKILIASRQSEFKDAIVQRIKDSFSDQAVYIKIIGIEDLEYEDPNRYSATLLINSAMGWKIDRKVEYFLVKHGELNSIIVLTTSNGGDILPDMKGRQIDAISAASIKEKNKNIADRIIGKIAKLIEVI